LFQNPDSDKNAPNGSRGSFQQTRFHSPFGLVFRIREKKMTAHDEDPPTREVVLFNAALLLPANERADYLSETCRDDGELHQRIKALLEAHEQAGAFLDEPLDMSRASSGVASSIASKGHRNELEPDGERCGDQVGRYKLLQQIGEGGCGVVYMADQEEPVRRRVALKIIKLGMDTRQVIARFEAERQALAIMDHPNIAKVFDAGATESGRPYFVMELVRGVKITDFCDENKVSTEERLRLFVQICHAIQHAHQKGIIHRDIKPTNILVSVNDGVAVPKVIDFGIAKATQGKLTDQTLFTAFEQFIGTPAYMSPEQAVMTNVEVDTRSDIYSLGVLLYELLTGQTPFAQKELLAAGVDEMRRTIREKDPVRPSTRLKAMMPGVLTTVAKNRQSQPPQLIHLVRGDLDWIVMKCLQKDRVRRYETANGLAMDIERYLQHQPVLARPDTQAYRIAKFVRRNRAAVAFASLIFLALIGGLTGTITQAHRAAQHARLEEMQRIRADEQARAAKQQRDFALRQLSRAEAINDLNSFLLSDAAPNGKPFTVGDLLAQAERVLGQQTGEPDDNRVELLLAIGQQYQRQEEHAKARDLLGKAYTMSRALPEPEVRAKAAAAYGDAIATDGEYARGEKLIQEALAELGDSPLYTWPRIFCLLRGSHVAREHGRADLGIERAVTAERLLRESGESSPLLDLTIAIDVAESYRQAGRNRQAAEAFAAAYKQLTALGRGQTDKAATLLNNWGVAVEILGRPVEAERLYQQAIAIETTEGGAETVSPMLLNNLARALTELQRFREAVDYVDRAETKARRQGAETVVSMCLNVRTTAYRELGQLDRAGEALAEFESRWKKSFPPGQIGFATIALHYALLYLARGDARSALAKADESIALCEATPEGHDRLTNYLTRRAAVRMQLKQFEEAQADAARALELALETAGPDLLTSRTGRAYLALARALKAQGKLSEARSAYTSAAKHLESSLGKEHAETLEAVNGAGS
jgi:serine/threonine protein kinase